MDVHRIHAVFAFLKIPQREWRNGVECFALASVKAFSFLHRIRYAARSAGTKDAVQYNEPTSDHEEGSDDETTSDSSNRADEVVLDSAHCHEANTIPPVSSPHACHTARNSQKRQYPGDNALTVCTKASLSFPATALEVDSIPPTKRRRRTRKSSKMRSSVGTVIRGKHSQYKTTSATASRSRQLRLRPCIADKLQYKTFDTNDPDLPIDTIQRYPPGYDSTKWNHWKNLERKGRGRM